MTNKKLNQQEEIASEFRRLTRSMQILLACLSVTGETTVLNFGAAATHRFTNRTRLAVPIHRQLTGTLLEVRMAIRRKPRTDPDHPRKPAFSGVLDPYPSPRKPATGLLDPLKCPLYEGDGEAGGCPQCGEPL